MNELRTQVRTHLDAAIAAINQLDKRDMPKAKKQLDLVIAEIVATRNKLIQARRAGEQVDTFIIGTNAVLSTMFGTEYPLAGLQWKRVTEAREALFRLVKQCTPSGRAGSGRKRKN